MTAATARRSRAPMFEGPRIAFDIRESGFNSFPVGVCGSCDAHVHLSWDEDAMRVVLWHAGTLCSSWDRHGELVLVKVRGRAP